MVQYGNYCSDCGTKLVKFTSVEKTQVEYLFPEFIEDTDGIDYDDFFVCEIGSTTYLLSNDTTVGQVIYEKYTNEVVMFNNIDQMKSEFYDRYSSLISLIKEVYGEVEIEFGLVNYWY